MALPQADRQDKNRQQVEQPTYVLRNRHKPTVVLISYDTPQKRGEVYQQLRESLPGSKFIPLNLESVSVTSLVETFKQELSSDFLRNADPSCIVNVFGLENSLIELKNGQLQQSQLVSSMNFERELYFREMPFTTIIWTDRYFLQQLGQNAPDLWGWITYVFEFSTPEEELAQEPLPYRERFPKRGKIKERQHRIDELEAKLQQMPVDDQSERNLRDRISLLQLLGEEYYEQFAFEEAIQRLKIALGLAEKLEDTFQQAHLHFLLGNSFLARRQFGEAEQHYLRSRSIFMEINDTQNTGGTYHQLGMVYEEQRKWNEALENYRQAIEWQQKTGNEFELGTTYHQIGMVYEEQRKWNEALENYRQAIEWQQKTGNEFELGTTYHQIGMGYQQQRKWNEALEHYRQAIEWQQKTGNEFELGMTYHQIGMVYQEQRKWNEALEHYLQAIEWKQKTGNEFELGRTYHQIGRVYEEQGHLTKAMDQYLIAEEYAQQLDQEYELSVIRESIQRVREKQAEQTA